MMPAIILNVVLAIGLLWLWTWTGNALVLWGSGFNLGLAVTAIAVEWGIKIGQHR